MDYGEASRDRAHTPKNFILCFDGTGNKFSGTDADSNILKLYRMLDRNGDDQFHYYQPGIGTYVTKANGSMSRTSRIEKFNSWYTKAKDMAVGTSFDQHVMAGYKFLMRYYTPGDEIYFFGFSRGAYTARFLAEMLDHVGLLSAGNEEMCQFAWKTFQKWQCRLPEDKSSPRKPGEKSEKKKLLEFMCAFRESFSRPVRPIRFLGLFDTVNSVPAFENSWMQRSTRFPYTARSSARVIRHAVSIDERRAKFRQDLISQVKPDMSMYYKRRHKYKKQVHDMLHVGDTHCAEELHEVESHGADDKKSGEESRGRRDNLAPPERFRNPHETYGVRSLSISGTATSSVRSYTGKKPSNPAEEDEEDEEQDIKEVWFSGGHADIGGGWPLGDQDAALSHVPLVWMVREAQRAGLDFDEEKLQAFYCYLEETPVTPANHQNNVPTIEVDPCSPSPVAEPNTSSAPSDGTTIDGYIDDEHVFTHHREHPDTPFHAHLHNAATKGHIHDVLQLNNGATRGGVLSWNLMEYLPFRRMDLQADGSWRAIRWPLPKGETRDIPTNAVIHCSVIKRMLADPNYRPGNLIVGGGGRGVRHAPKDMGMGKWSVSCEYGNQVGECFIRK
ncbi:hypothetical protein EJ02DRAFT_377914, partial [Clathrospora elynae]